MQLAMIASAPLCLLYLVIGPLYILETGKALHALTVLLVMASLFAWMMGTLVTIYRRRPVARWLGGAAIVLLMLLSVWEVMPSQYQRENDTVQDGHWLGALIVLGVECYWLYCFAFSAKARRYLGGR